ncbi:ribosomal L1 domain-containing protein 1 [Gadus macrocephalus]|uniref:ribosomal L1 domain-containing protein 1 n=1 Tax=Gadus macrocephalus TaxID=80720 RepID=UPI0028CB6EF3|nr:ribosomal L1 domain-containing protein 1 [Gadus macrocephalus]
MRVLQKHVKPHSSRNMAETNEALVLDREQVKKAVLALQAFLKSKSTSEALFLNESEHISLLFTLWKIPKKASNIRIPLPHNQRSDTDEVCLFTRDEPNMTGDQTQRFYKRLLEEKGINIAEVIPYKLLKTEYKSIESKRRLLGNFDLFLSDGRIRRLLPSHLGKNFYLNKKDPLSVDLQSKSLARDLKSIIHGTRMKINNKGSCCMASIGHSGMTTEQLTDNIESAVKGVVDKMRTQGPVVKLIHLKSLASVALPIYNAVLSQITTLDEAQKSAKSLKKKKVAKKVSGADDNDEEIPTLVPIGTPAKKAKLEKPQKSKKKVVLETAPKAPRPRRRRTHKPAALEKALTPNALNKSPKHGGQKKTQKHQPQKTGKPSPKPKKKARKMTK